MPSTSDLWGRVTTVLEKSQLNKVPPETVNIKTVSIRIYLGAILFQSVIQAMVFSIRDGIGTAWLIPVFTLLQIGWIWDKVLYDWGKPSFELDSQPSSPMVSQDFRSDLSESQKAVFSSVDIDAYNVANNIDYNTTVDNIANII